MGSCFSSPDTPSGMDEEGVRTASCGNTLPGREHRATRGDLHDRTCGAQVCGQQVSARPNPPGRLGGKEEQPQG